MDAAGNQAVLDGMTIAYDAMTNVAIPAATQPSVVAGTGAPTFSSIKGTLYLNLTGSTTATRLYINNGTTNWVAITTAS
jgi:hypothetical protein